MSNLNPSSSLISYTYFALYNILSILESFLLFANIFYTKTFPTLEHLRSVLCHLFFSFFKSFLRWSLPVQNNGNLSLWNMSNMHENQWTKFAQQKHKNNKRSCSGVFIVNFRGVCIEDPVKHLHWSFFCNSKDKS